MLGLGISLCIRRPGAGIALPANTALPTIAGTLQVGQVWAVTPGTWTFTPSLSYQWYRGGTLMTGATSTTYTLATADIGHTIKCRESDSVSVTHADSAASSTVLSNDTSLSTLYVFTSLLGRSVAWVDGATAECGASETSALIESSTTNAGATDTVNGSSGPNTYVTIAAGANTITVIVTAADGLTTATSDLTLNATGLAPVDGFLAPTIDNTTPTAGDTLTCRVNDTGSGATSYQLTWNAVFNAATYAQYIDRGDMGVGICCTVTPINAFGSGTPVATATTAAVTATPVCTVTPVCSNGGGASTFAGADRLYVDGTNSSTAAVFTGCPDPMPSVTHQWRNGADDIAGATGSSYLTVSPDDSGTAIYCRVTTDNGVGSPVSLDSNSFYIT